MAIFTAIATSIVTALGITGTLATVATAFIATGLAVGTAKILGVFEPPGEGRDPGVKIQLPPATDNKIPRLYGRTFASGTIVDAEIKNQNKTMAYCLVLSEMSDVYAETWTVNAIYRGDAQLNFTGANVISQIDPNATSSTAIANKMRVRVYAGGSASTYQIFPTTGKVNAYGTGNGQFANWTSANTMTDLVFAIIEIDYDPNNDLTGIGTFTFDIQTSLTNPAQVLVDYLNNERYGMGNVNFPVSVSGNTVTPENIDVTSLNAWSSYATTNNTMINGAISTFNSIRENINKICLSGGAFFTYNAKQGKFGVVVNTGANSAVKANAFVINNDNLVGALTVTSTDLFNMYNQIELEFPSIIQKDQTDTVFLEVPSNTRNINEPDNKINVRFDLTNDRQVAINLANIDLRQGRFTTVVTARGDYTTLPIDVGDIVKVTNDTYGWTDKLFRVMQTRETETQESMLYNELTLLEYDDSIFVWTTEDPSEVILPPGISNWWLLNGNTEVVLGNIFIGDNVIFGGNVIGYNPVTGNVTSNNLTIDDLITSANVNFGNTTPLISFPVFIPPNVTFDVIDVAISSNTTSNPNISNSVITTVVTPPPENPFPYFEPDTVTWISRPLSDFATQGREPDDWRVSVGFRDTITGVRSLPTTTVPLPIFVENVVDNTQIAGYGSGVQLENFADNTGPIANGNTFINLVTPIELDLTGIDTINEYSLTASAVPTGVYTGQHEIGLIGQANVYFANATAAATVDYSTGGVIATTDNIIPNLFDSSAIVLDPEYLASIDPFFPVGGQPLRANLWVQGYSTLSNTIADREFFSPKVQMLKLTKNERLSN